jgi:hypothetical protein
MSTRTKILVAIGVLLALFQALVLTNGQLSMLFVHRSFGTMIYANMWEHLLNGDFLTDHVLCGAECFFQNPTTTFSYFGFLPVFLRGLVSLFTTPYRFNLAGLSMLLAMALAFAAMGRAFSRLGLLSGKHRLLGYLYLVAIFVASPLLYLMAWDWIYHEPITWGLALTLVFTSAYLLWTYDERERTTTNGLLLGLAAGGAILCRPTTGLMLFIPYCYLLAREFLASKGSLRRGPFRPLVAGLVVCFAMGCLTMTVNFARWGSPFTFMDMRRNYQVLTSPERQAIIEQYGDFDLGRVGPSLAYYFLPTADNFSVHWPFITADRSLAALPAFDRYDYVEAQRVPLALNTAFFMFFAVLALRRRRHHAREQLLSVGAFLLGGLVVTVAMSGLFCLAVRYSTELVVPWIFLGAVFLIGQERSGVAYRLRWWHYALLVVSIYVALTSTLGYKAYIWETPPGVRLFIYDLMPPLPPNAITYIVGGQRIRQ